MPPSVGLLNNNVPVKHEPRSSVPPSPAVPAASAAPPTASGAPAAPTSAPVATAKSQGSPLPPSVNPTVTHVTLVPLADSTTNIPDLTNDEIKDIQGWMKVDKEYDTVWRKMKERMEEEDLDLAICRGGKKGLLLSMPTNMEGDEKTLIYGIRGNEGKRSEKRCSARGYETVNNFTIHVSRKLNFEF